MSARTVWTEQAETEQAETEQAETEQSDGHFFMPDVMSCRPCHDAMTEMRADIIHSFRT